MSARESRSKSLPAGCGGSGTAAWSRCDDWDRAYGERGWGRFDGDSAHQLPSGRVYVDATGGVSW